MTVTVGAAPPTEEQKVALAASFDLVRFKDGRLVGADGHAVDVLGGPGAVVPSANALRANYPAASYPGAAALVGAAPPYRIFDSDGSDWTQRVEDSTGTGLNAVWSAIQAIQTELSTVNHKLVVPGSTASVFDTDTSRTVNLLQFANDIDGDYLYIVGASFGGMQQTLGEMFSTMYGTAIVLDSGSCTYIPGAAAWALRAGQTATEVISFVATDGQGANRASTVTFTIVGQDNAPVTVGDVGRAPYNKPASGNVLANDYDPDKGTLSVTGFSVVGYEGSYTAGSTVTLDGVGVFTLAAGGAWSFHPVTGYSSSVVVNYAETNGQFSTSGTLTITISPAPANVLANPVTFALVGAHATYHVYTELDWANLQWGALQAGDVVNVYYKAEPYRAKIGIRGSGTMDAPIILNGVTDSSGNRPVLDWSTGAYTAPGCNPSGKFGGYLADHDVFSSTTAYGESLGGIVIKQGTNDPNDYKPKWIQIKNLEMGGTKGTYTSLAGMTTTWDGACIYVLRSDDCLIENCVISGGSNGIFTQAKDNTLIGTSVRMTIRNNRLYGNGVVGSFYEHNVYNQGYGTIVEGNFMGQLRAGATGSTYKSRNGAEIIRYNWFEANARALDMVHSEDNSQGIPLQPDYGVTWCYGNTIITDQGLANGASGNPIHFGGDNMGEQDSSSTVLVPTKPYRSQLYFWNNTFYARIDTAAAYKALIFQLSLTTTRCDAWNNIFILSGTTVFSWVGQAGVLNLRGTNLVYGTVADAVDTANSANYHVNKLGTLITGDPLVLDAANRDFHLLYSSAACDAGAGAPSGLPMSGIDDMFPVEYQPRKRSNGYLARDLAGTPIDCGSTEYGIGYTPPPPPAPQCVAAPYITGNKVAGGTLTAVVNVWLGRPTFTIKWKNAAGTVLGTGLTFTTSAELQHTDLHITVDGENSSGVASADSAAITVISTDAPINSVLPSITGTVVEGGAVVLNAGTWSNTPDSYEFTLMLDGVAIPGTVVTTSATTVNTTVPTETGHHLLSLHVVAKRVDFPLDNNDALSNGYTVTPAPADPDPSGTFNFSAINGTLLSALDGGSWQGGSVSSTQRFECVNGALQCLVGTGGNGELAYYIGSLGANQACEVLIEAGWTGSLTLYLQQTSVQSGYSFVVSASGWQARRGGGYLDGQGLSLSQSQPLKVKLSLLDGVFTAYVNDAQKYQYTDSSPLTGGGEGFIMGPGSDVTKMRMTYFKTAA